MKKVSLVAVILVSVFCVGVATASSALAFKRVPLPYVVSVNPVPNIVGKVATATPLASLGLPARVGVVLSNGRASTSPVTWNAGTPTYAMTAGTYVFSGTLNPPSTYVNPSNLKASVTAITQ